MQYIKGEDIVIGIDIALNKTGIAIMTPKLKILHTSTFTVKTSLPYLEKLDQIHLHFTAFFEEVLKSKPASVDLVLEGRLARGFSGSTLASIEGARVTAYHAFNLTLQRCEPGEKPRVFIYSPGIVKSFFTGKANASKSEVLKSAYSRFSSLEKIKFQEDIFDAIYLCLFHSLEGKKGVVKKSEGTGRNKKVSRAKKRVSRPNKAASKPRR